MVSRLTKSALLGIVLAGSSYIPQNPQQIQNPSEYGFGGKKVAILYSTDSGPRSSDTYARPKPMNSEYFSKVENALIGEGAYVRPEGIFRGNTEGRLSSAVQIALGNKNIRNMDYIVLADEGLKADGFAELDKYKEFVFVSGTDEKGKIKFEKIKEKK